MDALVSLPQVLSILRSGLPDAEWMLKHIESQNGWLRYPSFLAEVIENLKLQSYPLLYENEAAISVMMLKAFLTTEEIHQLSCDLDSSSIEQRDALLMEFYSSLNDVVENIVIPKTPAERRSAAEAYAALTPEEQQEAIRIGQSFYSSFLSSFHQTLSVMVHGEKLTSLVAQAKAGDDDAFVKAVQVDRRILTAIPYFRDRLNRSQMEADWNFSDKLSYRLKSPPYRGKIRYKSLWLTIATLDQVGWLDKLSYPELLDICDQIGLDGKQCRIQTAKHMGNRVREYREFQRRGVVTTA